MAKHLVKCFYCGQTFDASIEPFVKPKSNRYAHASCHNKQDAEVTAAQKEEDLFFQYCKEKFGDKFDYVRSKKLADGYIKKYGYSWSGMLKTLVYFFDVKKNSVEKAKGSIGIIPYTYQEAYNYYFDIWQAQQLNVNKKIEDYVPETIEVTIPPPAPRIKKRRLFSFLDRKEDD